MGFYQRLRDMLVGLPEPEHIGHIPPSTEPLIEGEVPTLESVKKPDTSAGQEYQEFIERYVAPAQLHERLKRELEKAATIEELHHRHQSILEAEAPRVDERPILGQHTHSLEDAYLDLHSPTWRFIKKYCENELDKSRKLNDSIKRSDIETAVLRGEIKMLKKIIELPNPKPGRVAAPETILP